MKIRYINAPQNLFAGKQYMFFRKYFCIFAEFRYKTRKCDSTRIFIRARRLRKLKKLWGLAFEFLHNMKTKTW